MHRLILAAALVLAACVPAQQGAVAFRSPAAPIWSAAVFDTGRLSGEWRQAGGFQAPGAPGCGAGGLVFRPAAGGVQVAGELCLNGTRQRLSGLATVSGPGRLQLNGQEEWWVLWVDSGYRTIAVGTPSGRFGFVLDRGAIPPDRLTAAREIFDFNGYAAGALRPF